jgi:saccharopine dehydrogenase (NAD+, L-lysine-forming)
MLKIGIKYEGKTPPDTRVALTPSELIKLKKKYPMLDFRVEKSSTRCYSDQEYEEAGFAPVDDISDCDIIFGVKETQIPRLLEKKTYLFFSHVIKKQPYNREKLRTALERKIRLIDYELLKDDNGFRVIGFGRFAGIVGAHYALWMWGKKKRLFQIKRAVECKDYQEMIGQYQHLDFGNARIVVTGNGRVSKGAIEILQAAGIREVSPEEYLAQSFNEAVYVQLDVDKLYQRKDGESFEFQHFFDHPEAYDSTFENYIPKTNVLINGMYWDPNAPELFQKSRIQQNDFAIEVISDISCDIDGSVPITTRATTIADPVYGYSAREMKECEPFSEASIDMMTVDNLPNELPRDASSMFAEVLGEKIIPLFIEDPKHPCLQGATICEDGQLTEDFSYLQDYVDGKS